MTKTKSDLGLCLERGCRERTKSRDRCVLHYCAWWRAHRLHDPDRLPRCDVCGGSHHGYGLCVNHYHKWVRWGDPLHQSPPMPERCSIEGCTRKPRRDGHCNTHHDRILKHGDPTVIGKRGAKPKLLEIPQEIRSLASAYVYSFTTGAERTPEMAAGHTEYKRLRKAIHAREVA